LITAVGRDEGADLWLVDLLEARIGQRTNDIMKVLTLGKVILLPATVLGGIMGMNFQVGIFDHASLFWA
jgi:Mg2+ and Co2+ transporter CorA